MKAIYAGYFWSNQVAQNVIYDPFPAGSASESVMVVAEDANEETQVFFNNFQTPGTVREVNDDFFMNCDSRRLVCQEAQDVIADFLTSFDDAYILSAGANQWAS